VSTNTIDINLFGIGYTYEYAFANKFTLSFGAGIVGSFGLFSVFDTWEYSYYSLHPYAHIEPRYYYNLQKRLRNGKNIDSNSGPFLAIDFACLLQPFAKRNISYNGGAIFAFAPYWGKRWMLSEHLLIEYHLGLTFGFNSYNNENGGLKIGGRLAYKF